MVIDVWEQAGLPSGYNPLPLGWLNYIKPLQIGASYVLTLRAKSISGTATLRVVDVGFHYIDKPVALTKEFQSLTWEFTPTDEERLYIYDMGDKGDIVIEDIKLVHKPLGRPTINGLDGFGSVKPGFTGRLTGKGDLANKIVGDMSVPHVANRGFRSSPEHYNLYGTEVYQSEYGHMSAPGGTFMTYGTKINGLMAQNEWQFDIVWEFERQIGTIPGNTRGEKVAWLVGNLSEISVDYTGYGSGPAGNKVSLRIWYYAGDAWGATTATHTGGAMATIARSVSSSLDNTIGPDGIVYAIAYAEPSDGTTSSYIFSDYVSLNFKIKQGAVIDSKWTLHQNAKIIDDETLELEVTSGFQRTMIDVAVEPSQDYVIRLDKIGITEPSLVVRALDANGNLLVNLITDYVQGDKVYYFRSWSNQRLIRVEVGSNGTITNGEKMLFKKPMLHKGSSPAPYEKKRGSRMVLPVARKNLVTQNEVTLISSHATLFLHDEKVPTVIGKPYTISAIIPSGVVVQPRIGDTSSVYNASNLFGDGTRKSMTIIATADFIKLRKYTDGGVGTLTVKDIQVEEGIDVTTFEPYEVQVSKKAPNANFDIAPAGGTNRFNWGLGLLVHSRRTLKSTDVKSVGVGSIEVVLKDLSNVTIYSKTFDLVAGINKLEFDWVIEPGKWVLGITGDDHVELTRDETKPSSFYPRKNNDGSVEVLGGISMGSLNMVPNSSWYFFFNMKFKGQTAPNKNMLDSTKWVKGRIFDSLFMPTDVRVDGDTVIVVAGSQSSFASQLVTVETNTDYTISHGVDDGSYGIYVYTEAGGDMNTSRRTTPVTINSGSNTKLIIGMYKSGALGSLPEAVFPKPQMEKGAMQTPFRSHTKKARPARRGLKFDGYSMILSTENVGLGGSADITVAFRSDAPKKTMCLIDQYSYGFAILINANGGMAIRYGSDTATTNYMSRETPLGVEYLDGKVHVARLKVEPDRYWFYMDGVLLLEGVPQTPGKTFSGLNMSQKYSIGARTDASGGVKDLTYVGDILYTSISDGVKMISEFDLKNPRSIVGTKVKAGAGADGLIVGKPIQLNRALKR
jgi:hypothetical protein